MTRIDVATRRTVLAYLEEHGRTPPGTLARHADLSREDLALLLEQLLADGTVWVSAGGYELARVRHEASLVASDFEDRVAAYLTGRKDSAAGVGRGTGLSLDEARAACEVLLAEGRLRATSVGSLRLYTAPRGAPRG